MTTNNKVISPEETIWFSNDLNQKWIDRKVEESLKNINSLLSNDNPFFYLGRANIYDPNLRRDSTNRASIQKYKDTVLAYLRSAGWVAEAGSEQWWIYPPGRYAQRPTRLEKVINTLFDTCLCRATKN